MGSLKMYAAMAGFLAIASTSARAADLLPPPPPLPEPYADIAGGWYLRGDVGVSHYESGRFRNASAPDSEYYGQDFGSGAFAGGGVGYQFNSWFRADVTGEYRFSTGAGTNDRAFYEYPAGQQNASYEKTRGDFSGAVVLVNGYFDLGTWWGVTPFIGGGVGYAYNHLNHFDTSTVNLLGTNLGGSYPISSPSGGTIRDGHKDSLAWALHAGLAYDVTPNVKLELAYRYLNLGETRTGLVDCFCGAVYQPFKSKELQSHDIKFGMRWLLGAPVVASLPEPLPPEPIIRKY